MIFTQRSGAGFATSFCPVMKHLRTEVQGSRKRRLYDRPATPFERLKQNGKADPAQLARLSKLFAQLDPFTLKEIIETKLKVVLRHEVRPIAGRAA